jgi:predicted Zn-dependent protease
MRRAKAALLSVLAACLVACVTTPETGSHAFILTSESTEARLGRDAYAQILAKERVSTDPYANELVTSVGQRIAAVTNHPEWAWEFKVLDSKQANAFCLPGGKVAVYTGLFPYLGNEAGLATVMGHEVGHAIARHGGQRMTQNILVSTGLMAASLSLGNARMKPAILGALGAGATVGVLLPFSRSEELEADEIGLYYMARAGYDPAEAVAFWKRFEAASAGKAPPELLSTHPSDEKRIEQMEKLQPRARQEGAKAKEHLGAGVKI